MTPLSSIEKYLTPIYSFWKYEGSLVRKVVIRASFIFGAITCCYSVYVGVRQLTQLFHARGKTNRFIQEVFFKDRLSQVLASFNNSKVKGSVNGIYITTNETNLEATNYLLTHQPRLDGKTIHIGCATWYNLDIICARKSTYGLIVDFNPENAAFIKKTIETVNSCESRFTFKEAMLKYLLSLKGEKRKLFFHRDQRKQPIEKMERELSRKTSWLENDESYAYIRQLAFNNRLVAITEDITNSKTFSCIRKTLNGKKITVDTLYFSNICNFMTTSASKNAFVKSIIHLLHRDTVFISCPKIKKLNSPKTNILCQNPILGRDVLMHTYDTHQLFEIVDS